MLIYFVTYNLQYAIQLNPPDLPLAYLNSRPIHPLLNDFLSYFAIGVNSKSAVHSRLLNNHLFVLLC